MNREVAEKLLILVNNIPVMEALEEYIRLRVEFHRDMLEAGEYENSRGALAELRRFKNLRDEVIQYSRKENGR